MKEVRSIVKSANITKIGKINESELSPEEIRKIQRQVINTRGELYFSKVLILCEGETEEQALPLLLKKYFNKSTIELGIDIVGIGGGGNYFPFMCFAENLHLKWFILGDGEANILKKLKKDYKKLSGLGFKDDIKLPSNIIHFDDEDNFESYLISNGFLDEIENCLKIILNVEDMDELIANMNGTSKGRAKTGEICENCKQYIFVDSLRNYEGEEGRITALKDLLSKNKTKYSSILAELIYNSGKDLPPKLLELFDKVKSILNPQIND